MNYYDNPANRRRSSIYAIASSCCGVTGETALTDSAVIILFAAALGASDMLSLVTTSVLPLFNGLFIIPLACISTHLGRNRLIRVACTSAIFAFLAAASAPFFGHAAMPILIISILWFAGSLPGFIAGWFPLLDSFLLPEKRTSYLGRMRLMHQLSALLFLLGVGYCIGNEPSILSLQITLYIAAVIFAGRLFFLCRIPPFEESAPDKRSCRAELRNSLNNHPMILFSFYEFVLNLLSYGCIPMAILLLKNTLKVGGNQTVLISDCALLGMALGYMFVNKAVCRFSARKCFIAFHLAIFFVCVTILFVQTSSPVSLSILALALAVCGFCIAAGSVVQSAEMMFLAKPGNKTMDMAIGGALFYSGCGFSRLLSSFLLKLDLPEMSLGGFSINGYHWFFLGYALLLIPALLLLYKIPIMHRSTK